MEKNVMQLLEIERKVNAKVKEAQDEKSKLLMSVKKQADIQVNAYQQ